MTNLMIDTHGREPSKLDDLSRLAERLFRLSQECMDLGVAERLRELSLEVTRMKGRERS